MFYKLKNTFQLWHTDFLKNAFSKETQILYTLYKKFLVILSYWKIAKIAMGDF